MYLQAALWSIGFDCFALLPIVAQLGESTCRSSYNNLLLDQSLLLLLHINFAALLQLHEKTSFQRCMSKRNHRCVVLSLWVCITLFVNLLWNVLRSPFDIPTVCYHTSITIALLIYLINTFFTTVGTFLLVLCRPSEYDPIPEDDIC